MNQQLLLKASPILTNLTYIHTCIRIYIHTFSFTHGLHKASLNSCQKDLSWDISLNSCQSIYPTSPCIVLSHVSLGLPCPLLLCDLHSAISWTYWSSLLKKCIIHLHLNNITRSFTLGKPTSSHTALFVICCCHLIPRILLSDLFQKQEIRILTYSNNIYFYYFWADIYHKFLKGIMLIHKFQRKTWRNSPSLTL